jgi:hypothetical protein
MQNNQNPRINSGSIKYELFLMKISTKKLKAAWPHEACYAKHGYNTVFFLRRTLRIINLAFNYASINEKR